MADWPNPDLAEVPYEDSPEKFVVMIGDVVATLLTREDPSEPVEYTSHPVEAGEDMTDYARDLPPILTLECKFYSDPVVEGSNLKTSQALTGQRYATWEQKRDAILSYKKERTEIDVFTGYQLYPSRRLSDVILDRSPSTSAGWSVTLIFIHVKSVNQGWASVSLDKVPGYLQSQKLKDGAKKGPAPSNSGEKPALGATEEKEAEAASLLRRVFGRK